MKSKKNLLELLKPLPYFSKDTLSQLGKQLKLADTTIDTYISRFMKHKEIIQLKKGLYISTDFFKKNGSNTYYTFYLANIIRTPSYISSWSALQFYNLSTEATYSITSITPKVTRNYKTKAGNFTYHSIKKELFSNFNLVQGELNFYIASPAKALFDLLYFKTHQFSGIRSKDIKLLVEELRIDIDEMNKKERTKFHQMIKKYFSYE